MDIKILTIADYDSLYDLWQRTPGVGLRSIDDSKQGIEKFLNRNPHTNFAAIDQGKIIGAILCGNDGRRGYIYHTCLDENYRKQGIAKQLVKKVCDALADIDINKVALVCFENNELGNGFWSHINFEKRVDLNYYNLSLNNNNL